MEENVKTHGGRRSNCGRKPKNRNNKIIIRISDEAMEILSLQKNKTEFIEGLILGRKDTESEGN